MSSIWFLALVVLSLNLPFGYWRGGVPKFSLQWFLAIHLPVPLVAGMRILTGQGWSLTTLPLLVGAFVAGQLLGARLRKSRRTRPAS
jgi:hypothetical protein